MGPKQTPGDDFEDVSLLEEGQAQSNGRSDASAGAHSWLSRFWPKFEPRNAAAQGFQPLSDADIGASPRAEPGARFAPQVTMHCSLHCCCAAAVQSKLRSRDTANVARYPCTMFPNPNQLDCLLAGCGECGACRCGCLSHVSTRIMPRAPALHRCGALAGQRWCPEEDCNFISKLFFLFPNGLMELGSRKVLEHSDLWDLTRQNEAGRIHSTYDRQLQRTASLKYPHVREPSSYAAALVSQPHLPRAVSFLLRMYYVHVHACTDISNKVSTSSVQVLMHDGDPYLRMQGSVWTALLRSFGARWAFAGLIKLVHDGFNLSTPYVLRRLLKAKKEDHDISAALGYAVLLFVCGVTTALLVNQYFLRVFNTSLYIKAALIQALYSKSLRISLPAKSELGGGTIANLQSNDAAKLWQLANYGHVLWSGPLQVRRLPLAPACAASLSVC